MKNHAKFNFRSFDKSFGRIPKLARMYVHKLLSLKKNSIYLRQLDFSLLNTHIDLSLVLKVYEYCNNRLHKNDFVFQIRWFVGTEVKIIWFYIIQRSKMIKKSQQILIFLFIWATKRSCINYHLKMS